jgi:signal transduction histidine kinase
VRYISHELRTPLNSAYLGLRLLVNSFSFEDQLLSDDEIQDTAQDVMKSVAAAVEILDGLLCHDKLESGILRLHKTKLPLVPLLRDCFSSFIPHARQCKVNITLSLDPAADADPGQEFILLLNSIIFSAHSRAC